MHVLRAIVVTLAVGLLASVPSRADLLATSVAGSISIPVVTATFGTAQTINDGIVPEFIGVTTGDIIAADFTGTNLTLTDIVGLFGAQSRTETFSDAAFAGAGVTPTSDNYVGGINLTQSGDQLSFFWAGTSGLNLDPIYQATYSITPVRIPEPGGLSSLMTVLGILGAGLLWRRASTR